jgi:hypothetical protein
VDGSFDFENLGAWCPSGRLCDFASLDTTGANLHTLSTATGSLNPYGLQVGIEATARAIVRVRDIIAELRGLATDFASFSHDYQIPPSFRKTASRDLSVNKA